MNWSIIEQMAIMLALTLLKAVIKSPAATAEEKSIISQIATAATSADTAVSGTVWTSAPAAPTPAA